MRTVAIIGGGITGMTALYRLAARQPDWKIILIEQNGQLGGKIRTANQPPFTIETGADSIVARNAGVLPLIEELGLQEQLVYNETGVSYLYTDNRLHKIPEETVFGIPTSMESLEESTLVSEDGKAAARRDFTETENIFGPDDSVGAFLTYYLGSELVEKQIAPVLSGVYSGSLDELTLKTTLPYLLDFKEEYGSIIKGFAANREKFLGEKARKKFVSFRGGLATLIDRLEEKSAGARILKNTAVTTITPGADGYTLSCETGELIQAHDVILAVPPGSAGRMLDHQVLNPLFAEFRNASLLSVYLGLPVPDNRLPADGTGFIVTTGTDLLCDASTWTSRKWAHTSADRSLLVRFFYKSSNPRYRELAGLTETELAAVARADLQKSLGITAEPETIEITSWAGLMPRYQLNHGQAVSELETALDELYPGIYLAGCAYYGVGIGACIQNGQHVAEKIMGP